MTVPVIMTPSEEHLQQPPDRALYIAHPLSGDTISPAYIHTVQHLIEKCLLFKLNQEESVSVLEKHANVKPVVTRIVWNELEKVNPEFFAAYNSRQRPDNGSIDSSTTDSLDKALFEATIATASSHAI